MLRHCLFATSINAITILPQWQSLKGLFNSRPYIFQTVHKHGHNQTAGNRCHGSHNGIECQGNEIGPQIGTPRGKARGACVNGCFENSFASTQHILKSCNTAVNGINMVGCQPGPTLLLRFHENLCRDFAHFLQHVQGSTIHTFVKQTVDKGAFDRVIVISDIGEFLSQSPTLGLVDFFVRHFHANAEIGAVSIQCDMIFECP
mmetsp:Transcript_15547/g.33878  ORF Transcript_15547/g.33878 Transcript_15547/m.33878 type:complete len:203 (-) Transcript_15547:1083-1691(-)